MSERIQAHVVIDKNTEIQDITDNSFTYMDAKFEVQSTNLSVPLSIYPQQKKFILVVGKKALDLAFILVQKYLKNYQHIGLQAIEVNIKQQLYCDLHQSQYEYVKMTHEFQLETPISFEYNDGQTLDEFIKRMTIRHGKQSHRPSQLFCIRPRCDQPNCNENHGEIKILSIGDAFNDQMLDLIDTLTGKKQFERSLLKDLIHEFVGKNAQITIIENISPGTEQDMVALLVQAGVY